MKLNEAYVKEMQGETVIAYLKNKKRIEGKLKNIEIGVGAWIDDVLIYEENIVSFCKKGSEQPEKEVLTEWSPNRRR